MTTLTQPERLVLASLPAIHEAIRYNGTLYVRHFTQFWRVVDGQAERWGCG